MGGCLFVDEAYSLAEGSQDAGGGGDAFSKDAIRTLLTEVENNRKSLLCYLSIFQSPFLRILETLLPVVLHAQHIPDFPDVDFETK